MKSNHQIGQFWETLDLPKSCYLGNRITKKMLLESEHIKPSDKKFITDDLDRLYWQYTLKPATITITPYQSNDLDYGEIAVLHGVLRNPKRAKRLAEIIQRLIPYPLLLVFTDQNQLRLSLALKRQNLADKQKLTIESFFDTGWLSYDDTENNPAASVLSSFLQSLESKQFRWESFYTFYLSMVERVLAFNRALVTEKFTLNRQVECNELLALQSKIIEYYNLLAESESLKKKASKSKQLGKQVDLNTQIHQLKIEADLIKQSL